MPSGRQPGRGRCRAWEQRWRRICGGAAVGGPRLSRARIAGRRGGADQGRCGACGQEMGRLAHSRRSGGAGGRGRLRPGDRRLVRRWPRSTSRRPAACHDRKDECAAGPDPGGRSAERYQRHVGRRHGDCRQSLSNFNVLSQEARASPSAGTHPLWPGLGCRHRNSRFRAGADCAADLREPPRALARKLSRAATDRAQIRPRPRGGRFRSFVVDRRRAARRTRCPARRSGTGHDRKPA